MGTAVVLVSIIASALVIIGAIVGVVVFVRGAYGAARLQAVREDNNDLRAALADSDRERQIDKAKISSLFARVEQLEAERTTLRDMALQHANVDKVIAALEEHDRKSQEMWRKIMTKLESMETA